MFGFGFFEMVEANFAYPERLRDYSFAIWEAKPITSWFFGFSKSRRFWKSNYYAGYSFPTSRSCISFVS